MQKKNSHIFDIYLRNTQFLKSLIFKYHIALDVFEILEILYVL